MLYNILADGSPLPLGDLADLSAARDQGRKYLASHSEVAEILIYTTSPYAPVCRIHWDDDQHWDHT